MALLYEKMRSAITYLQSTIGHRHCFICKQASHTLLCDHCASDTILPLFPSPGHNLLDYDLVYKNLAPPAYEGLYSLGKYEGVLAGLINQLKFSNQAIAADVLSAFFVKYLGLRLSINNTLPDALVPIPLSHMRYMHRQYNQSRLLSKQLANEFGIASIDGLKRVKHTKQQSRLNKEERQSNIENAFALNLPIEVDSIALVDDVVTTGATINEACKCLHETYPDLRISIWSLAITMK